MFNVLGCIFSTESYNLFSMVLAVFLMTAPILGIVAYVLWEKLFRQKWREFHSRDWPRVEGRFDEGEVGPMRRARSKEITGYAVWFWYEYGYSHAHGEPNADLYLSREFADEEKAEEYRKSFSNKTIRVRVSPRKPSKSYVLESDLEGLL